MSDRKGLFKNADRDMNKMRRNRQDHSIEIRKIIKDDHLLKKRNIDIEDLLDSSPIKENIKPQNNLSYKTICKMMKSSVLAERLEAVSCCRKQLSRQRNPPIEQFYNNGVIPILVEILRSEVDENILFETAWALTNIASGESRHTAAVVQSGAVDIFISMMEHRDLRIAEQSIWALSNIAGDSAKDRNLIIDSGIVPVVIGSVRRFWNNIDIIRQLSWLISNLCRHKCDTYPTDAIIELLPLIYELMSMKDDSPVHTDLTWALSYATDNQSSIVNSVIVHQFLPIVNSNLSKTVEIVGPSIRLMGNIIAGTDEQANAAIAAGVIESMGPLLTSSTIRIVKECCWLLSNISAGTDEQVMELVNSDTMMGVFNVLKNGDYKSQKEAVWVIANMVTCKLDEPKLFLLNNDIFSSLVPLLTCDDSKIVMLILDAIRGLFVISDSFHELEQCTRVFEEAGGVTAIEELQNHRSDEVYKLSYDLVKDFFSVDEDDGDTESNSMNLERFEF